MTDIGAKEKGISKVKAVGSDNTGGARNSVLENWFKGKIDEPDVHTYYLQIVPVMASAVAVFAQTYR